VKCSNKTTDSDPDRYFMHIGDVAGTGWLFYLVNTGSDDSYSYRMGVNSKTAYVEVGTDATDTSDGNWHNYTGVYNGTKLFGYRDGVLINDQDEALANVSGQYVHLGMPSDLSVGSNTKLWGFGIWSRMLTAPEIQTLWRQPYIMLAQPPILRYNSLGSARIFDLMPFLPM
jgi:hypothetical protein